MEIPDGILPSVLDWWSRALKVVCNARMDLDN